MKPNNLYTNDRTETSKNYYFRYLVDFAIVVFVVFAAISPVQAEKVNSVIISCQKPLGHHLFYRKMTCPLGGEKFRSLVLGTHSTYGKYFDMKPVSYMNFPAPLAVCPSNGFVITKAKYSSKELASIKKVIERKEYKALLGLNTSYYLLAKKRQMLNKSDPNLYWYYLISTWEAYKCDDNLYQKYARTAIKFMKRKISQEKVTAKNNNLWFLHLMQANLYRRLGEFEKAEKLLSTNLKKYKTLMPEQLQSFSRELLKHVKARDSKPKKIKRDRPLQKKKAVQS